jgi:hypothetical protein
LRELQVNAKFNFKASSLDFLKLVRYASLFENLWVELREAFWRWMNIVDDSKFRNKSGVSTRKQTTASGPIREDVDSNFDRILFARLGC